MNKKLLATYSTLLISSVFMQAAGSAGEAWNLYGQKQYAASAKAFESLIVTSTPDARLYYYAAMANREAGKKERAKQLFNYVATNFATTSEGEYSRRSLAALDTAGAMTNKTGSGATATTTNGSSSGLAAAAPNNSNNNLVPEIPAGSQINSKRRKMAFVFTAEDIARDGANGIDQTNAPNCWFESSMAALAELPKGQRLISQMIRYGDGDSYIVRFPGDGIEYVMTEREVEASGVKNHALWASLLDYAERRKFPNNSGASGPDGDKSRLEVGLASITGCKAEVIRPGHCDVSEISSFINGALRSGNPIVAGTAGRNNSGYQPIFESHAYTIIGWDSSRNMVILRNPHGRKSKKFELYGDSQHLRFEQLPDGVFKMSVPTFHDSFGSACRSFI